MITRFIAPATIATFALLLVEPTYVTAQANDDPDYGAETIEDLGYSGVLPLPVELVEEQGESFITPPQAIETNNQALPSVEIANIPPDLSAAANGDSVDELIAADSADGIDFNSTTTVLNVKDVEITTLVKTFSKLTRRSYIVDSAVKGKVTVHLPDPITIAEALRIFDSVLLLKGFTTVPIGENVWKVIAAKSARQTTIPLVGDPEEPASDTIVTHLVRLKHVVASDMQKLLGQFVSKDGIINSFSGTNALILIDSQANIERLKKLIDQLDVPPLDQEITIIPVVHADAKDIADKIEEILGEKEDNKTSSALTTPRTSSRSRARRNARNSTASSTASSTSVDAKRSLPLKLIPDERTNSLIVVADEELTAKVQALVETLDSSVDLSGGRFYVYRLKHADAEELSEIMNNLISGATGDSDSSSSGTRGSSLSRSSSASSSTRSSSSLASRLTDALRRRRSQSSSASGRDRAGRVTFEGEISIAPDPATNSLIINAARSDYEKLKEVISDLDVKRRQVLVEATILEVSLDNNEGMGFELQGSAGGDSGGVLAQTNYNGLTNLLTNPAALTDLTVAAASSGTITLPGGLVIPSQAVLLTAVSRHSNVNVLSSPNIVTTDNEEAEIIVGENVPFVTSTSTDSSNINNTFNQIERQDVGITLRITPQISTGDFVTLNIFVEISNVVAGTRNDPNGPTTTIRTTETTVEVRSDQMIVTGGLISDNVTESTRGIPFLQDIPALGHLFQRADTDHRRTNLLIFITPRIITDQYDARETTIEYRDKLDEIIEEQGASPDRRNVLHDDSIDRVTEHRPADGFIPTPITPVDPTQPSANTSMQNLDVDQRAAVARTRDRLQALAKAVETAPAESAPVPLVQEKTMSPEAEVLDVTVRPRLPGVEKTETPPIVKQTIRTETLKPPAVEPAAMAAPQQNVERTFIVLRQISGGSDANLSGSPIVYADDQGTVGLSVVGSISSSSGSFFQVGRRYSYTAKSDTAPNEFVCLGRFGSIDEARVVHSSLAEPGRWNQLSPKETLSLGQGPWKN